jgi:hypothetical protein
LKVLRIFEAAATQATIQAAKFACRMKYDTNASTQECMSNFANVIILNIYFQIYLQPVILAENIG